MNNDHQEIKKITFANTEEEAIKRFEKYAKKDPLPDIPPALLNSADIQDYVAITGMIFPFHPEKEKGKLKTASYEVDLLGTIIYWDKNNIKKTEELTKGKTFKLVSNSIAFVTPEPTFRLPDYIAVRFNLKITNVHRGILLGTGPLVDPGYEGKLLIPLHNLTSNDYIFTGGEGFIWMEFTKLSPLANWIDTSEKFERTKLYDEFPQNKKSLNPEILIAKALKNQEGSTIRSSIMSVFYDIQKSANDARDEANKTKIIAEQIKEDFSKKIKKYSVIGVLALLIGLASILASVYIGNRQFINLGLQNQGQIEQLRQEIKILNQKFEDINVGRAKPIVQEEGKINLKYNDINNRPVKQKSSSRTDFKTPNNK